MPKTAAQENATPENTASENSPTTEVAPQEASSLIGTFDFGTLVSAPAAEVRGFRLVDQSALEMVPFVIVGIHVRDGVKRPGPTGYLPTNYLSVECVTADETTLSRLIRQNGVSQMGSLVNSVDSLSVRPNEMVVFNDGSTGVARQLVTFLHMTNRINVGDTSKPNGVMGESSFDRYHGDWVSGGRNLGDDNAPDPAFYGSPLLKCMRGLRYSEYQAEATGAEARTWYLG